MLLGLLESPMRPQLIPASNGLNPEREGGVQHVGKRLETEGYHFATSQRKTCMVKARLLESQS
jgi:hypothetical protein